MTVRRHPMLDPRGRPPGVSRIEPRFLVGEYPRPEDVAELRAKHGVTAVVSLQDDDDLAVKGLRLSELVEAYAAHGIELRRVPIADNDPEAVELRLDAAVEALQELVEAGHTVLLHCNAGYNRAPTIAIAWLHRHRGLSLAEADLHVRARRPCVPFLTVLRARFG